MAKRKKPLVVVTRKLPDSVETRMRELFEVELNLDDKPMSQAELMVVARFGGIAYDSNGNFDLLDDLWKYAR